MKWCPNDSPLLEYGPDPSLCFAETFGLFVVNMVVGVFLLVRYSLLFEITPFEYPSIRNARIQLAINVLASLLAVFSVILIFAAIDALSSIFYAASNIFLWIVVLCVISSECKRLGRWPSVWIIIATALNLLGHVLLASVIFQRLEGSTVFLGCSAGSVVCIFIILVLTTLKDVCRSEDETNEEELQRYSIEFASSSPIREQNREHLCGRLAQVFSSSFSGNSDQGLSMRQSASTVRVTKLDFSHSERSWINMWPFRQSTASVRHSDFQSLLEDDLDPEADDFNVGTSGSVSVRGSQSSSATGRGSFIGGANSNHSYQYIESAMEKNVQGNFERPKPEKESTSRGFLSRHRGRNAESADTTVSPMLMETRDSELSMGSGSNASRSSRVVAQVLEEHRARMSAATPLLEPSASSHHSGGAGGSGNGSGIGSGARDALGLSSDRFALPLQQDGSSHHHHPTSPGRGGAQLKKSLRVTVQRWGYRARRAGGSAETEFEVVSATNSGAKYSIWRTVAEVYRLHSAVVSQLGDFAPRRPPLRSDAPMTTFGAGGVPMSEDQVDFGADMRSLAVYLNALLRVEYQDNPHLAPLCEFLEVPLDALSLKPAAGASSTNNTSNNNNNNSSGGAQNADDLGIYTDSETLDSKLSPAQRGGAQGGAQTGGATSPITTSSNTTSSTAAAASSSSTTANAASSSSAAAAAPTTIKKSQMEAAQLQQADSVSNQQEKWRKLIFQMKIKLRPRDIAVRCRLFEGVISGGDISKFLMFGTPNTAPKPSTNTNTNSTSNASNNNNEGQLSPTSSSLNMAADAAGASTPTPNNNSNNNASASSATAYDVARDRFEALRIGQELLSCGLLLPVALGYTGDALAGDQGFLDEDEEDDADDDADGDAEDVRGSGSARRTPTRKATTPLSSVAGESTTGPVFSDLHGFIFRFPGKSGTAGSCSLFGAPATVHIRAMDFSDESSAGVRDTVTLPVLGEDLLGLGLQGADGSGAVTPVTGAGAAAATAAAATASNTTSHVIYFIETSHGDDTWPATRRYREFEQLNRALLKEGLRPEVPLPTKSLVNALARMTRQAQLDENRRAGLEAYLGSALQAVVDSSNNNGRRILAEFLDVDHHTLRMP